MSALVIRGAEVEGRIVDVRIEADRVVDVTAGGSAPVSAPGDQGYEAGGGALLPGLHDHHIHLLALAAAARSVKVGPADVGDADGLARALQAADAALAPGRWLRAVGYHESVAGPLDRHDLDTAIPARPARVQHRGGAMWVLNSAAVDRLGLATTDVAGVERAAGGRPTGRLFTLCSSVSLVSY